MPWRKNFRYKWVKTVYGLRRLPLIHQTARFLKNRLWVPALEAGVEFGRRAFATSRRLGPPVDGASVYQMLRTGDPPMRGRILLHDQGCPVVTQDSLMTRGNFHQHKEQPWPIFWSYHSNARLVAESLALLVDDKTICLESVYGYRRLRDDPAFRYFALHDPVRLHGNWTSIISRWVPCGKPEVTFNVNHSHWLLDALPRLAALEEYPLDTRILVPANLHAQHRETLAMLGLSNRCRSTTEHHFLVENYYFCPPTSMLACYNPYAIQFLRNAFLPKRDTAFHGPKRFFIQRAKDLRSATNEGDLENWFAKRGWSVIDVAKLNFAQQIQLFHEAEAIAGMSGSALTNTLFCSPACRVRALIFDWAPDAWIEWIAQVAGFDWRYGLVQTDYTRQYRIEPAMLEALIGPDPAVSS